jgi:NADH:ubiquinone oxidoreductase subunit 5 (subunit L)/multisubunit Na+/H+ antiporter MnhA subunit
MSNFIEWMVSAVILIPLLMFVFSLFTRIRSSVNYSKSLSISAIFCQLALFLLALGILGLVLIHKEFDLLLFSWFKHAKVVYNLNIHLDLYTSLLLLLSTFLSGVMGRFSLNYLAFEDGYYKFFINFYLMQLALFTLIMSSNFYFVLISWELLGLASVFLISFYQSSSKTVSNSLLVLGIYKFCDLFLILALLIFHHEQHIFVLERHLHPVSLLFLISLVIASMGKSAVFPFSKWVPRAMEGPTTSSAIFYGALSIHAGVILLLKFRHVFVQFPDLNGLIVGLGVVTAIYASLKSRIQTDAKSTLAYATVVQVGLIYIEFGLGLYLLVVVHTLSNALLKTYQFIRTPSNIHHFHHLEKLNYQKLKLGGLHFETLLPLSFRVWAYKAVYHNFGLTLVWQTCLGPFKRIQTALNQHMETITAYFKRFKVFHSQPLVLVLGILLVIGLVGLERIGVLNHLYLSGTLLVFSLVFALVSLKHATISLYLIKIKISYFLISASALLFFGDLAHVDAVLYFVSNLISLFVLSYFIKYLSRRLDLNDIRSYLGIGNRYKYINMIAIAILLMLTFTPGFATFVIFDVILEDISEKSMLMVVLFLIVNTLNIYSIFKFIFKIIFGESKQYFDEYPDFSRFERLKLAALILPVIAVGVLPFMIYH